MMVVSVYNGQISLNAEASDSLRAYPDVNLYFNSATKQLAIEPLERLEEGSFNLSHHDNQFQIKHDLAKRLKIAKSSLKSVDVRWGNENQRQLISVEALRHQGVGPKILIASFE